MRHLVMDAGKGYELHDARRSATLTLVFSGVMTLLTWVVIYSWKGL